MSGTERSASLPFTCARIAGRTRALLGLPLRDGHAIEVHSDLLEECLDLVPEVRAYFIHQKGDLIDVAVRTASANLPTVRRRFLDLLGNHCADIDEANLIFSVLAREPYTAAGKRLFVLRESATEARSCAAGWRALGRVSCL